MPLGGGNIRQIPAGPCLILRRGRCLHRPGNPCDAANPRRRARTPALHCGHKQVPARQRQPSARPDGRPMKSSAPTLGCGGRSARETTRRRDTACLPRFRHPFALHCRAGVHARRGALRQPRRILARQGAAPLSRLTPTLPVCGARIALRVLKHTCVLRPPHLLRLAVSAAGGARLRSPLQGSLPGGSSPKASPARGGGCAARADGGVHCRLAVEISAKARQSLALCFVGDDACIVPETLRCRRPQAAGEIARPTLRPGAGGNRYVPDIRQARRRADENHRPLRRVCLPAETACATAASLSASPFRPAGAGRSPIGRPGELLRGEKRRTTRHESCDTIDVAILGRPHLAPGGFLRNPQVP